MATVGRGGRRSLLTQSRLCWITSACLFLFASSLLGLGFYSLSQPLPWPEPMPRPHFTLDRGDQLSPPPSSSKFAQLFPFLETQDHSFWPNENSYAMRRLIECMATESCGVNQTKVVLLVSWDFTFALEGQVSGENIWANSIIYSLFELGYSFLFAEDHRQLSEQYRMLPSLVKVIIAHSGVIHDCLLAEECIKSSRNPNGVPLWKMFGLEFWKDSYLPHPLGNEWTLAPTEYGNGHIFIGYSVNHTCTLQPFLPHRQRKHQAFVLAKRLSYFFKDTYAWPGVDYANPPPTLHDLAFVGAIWNDTRDEHLTQPAPQIPAGIRNLDGATLPTDEFYAALSSSKVLVGVGQPYLSPSPYDALCLGVPFINPVYQWDHQNPQNRSAWAAQHDGLRYVEEPFVYHPLRMRDLSERAQLFWDTIARAVNTPIDRFIPEDMTPEAVTARISHFVETDWRHRAEQLKAAQASGVRKLINFTL